MHELPDKPSLSEIESVFKECEDALGPFNVYMHWAMNKLLAAARAQDDFDLERLVIERYIPFVEHKKSEEHVTLVRMLARLRHLHFIQKRHDESAEEVVRALNLDEQHKRRNPKIHGLLSQADVVFAKKLLVFTYTSTENLDAAEAALSDLLPVHEEEEGVLSEGPLGTQSIRGTLISVYIKQGRKALLESKDRGSVDVLNRYLRDALALIEVHSAFYSHNLKTIGRLFIWAGRTSDGLMAFRLANHIYEAGKKLGSPQRNCLCDTDGGLQEVHGFRQCDAFDRKIALNHRWFFCRTCADVDLCADCYAGVGQSKEREWEDICNISKTCLGHEFFEVRGDEREERIPVHVWIEDASRRLAAEIKYGDEE